MAITSNTKIKRIGANKWFYLDWARWLADGETITGATWALQGGSGLTEVSTSISGTLTGIKLSGGNVGTWTADCTLTTSAPLSQTEVKQLLIKVEA